LYADAYSTISNVAVVYGTTVLRMSPKDLGFLVLMVPVAAMVGVFFFRFAQKTFHISTKTMLFTIIVMLAFIPLYGSVKVIDKPLELQIVGIYYGFLLGPVQSFSRALYAEIIPPGFESEFFSMYQITDKGGAWIGPLAVALLSSVGGTETGSRLVFVFLLTMFILALLLLTKVNFISAKQKAMEYSKHIRESQSTTT
jgi:UMF1 family MFS transporter